MYLWEMLKRKKLNLEKKKKKLNAQDMHGIVNMRSGNKNEFPDFQSQLELFYHIVYLFQLSYISLWNICGHIFKVVEKSS